MKESSVFWAMHISNITACLSNSFSEAEKMFKQIFKELKFPLIDKLMRLLQFWQRCVVCSPHLWWSPMTKYAFYLKSISVGSVFCQVPIFIISQGEFTFSPSIIAA